jgi:serine/threonine protein kinase
MRRLGSGGFGEVWQAEGQGGFPVALKFVRLGEAIGEAELRALDIIKGLRHPNVLYTFGAWQIAGFLVIGMELADATLGDRFHDAVNHGLPGMPRDEVLECLAQAARGIDYLNSPTHGPGGDQAVQHRDIKPQNILILGGGVKVADFGLAKLLEHSVTSHTGGLTLAYAAPEFFNKQVAMQSDQYSLAVTYCHLRGGRLPFTGSPMEVIAGHLLHPPDLTMLPEDERPSVARGLAKNPAERWPNCGAFVDAIRSCGESVGKDTATPTAAL